MAVSEYELTRWRLEHLAYHHAQYELICKLIKLTREGHARWVTHSQGFSTMLCLGETEAILHSPKMTGRPRVGLQLAYGTSSIVLSYAEGEAPYQSLQELYELLDNDGHMPIPEYITYLNESLDSFSKLMSLPSL